MRCSSTWFVLAATLALLVGVAAQSQAGITVDGDLSDWGITIDSSGKLMYDETAYNHYVSSPIGNGPGKKGSTVFGGLEIRYHLEDSSDTSNNYQVGPQYGGQNYDAEALLVAKHNNTLFIAIASGQRPDNAPDGTLRNPNPPPDPRLYGPGDIRILTDALVDQRYGIEVGGGPGGITLGADPNMLDEKVAGWTYTLDGNGYTYSSSERAGIKAGSLFHTAAGDWKTGMGSEPTQLNGGDFVVAGDYAFSFAKSWGEHSFIEVAIPYYDTIFNGGVVSVKWGPACANDLLSLCVTLPPPPPVPEPGGLVVWALLALSCGGCSWWRWRQKQRQPAQ